MELASNDCRCAAALAVRNEFLLHADFRAQAAAALPVLLTLSVRSNWLRRVEPNREQTEHYYHETDRRKI